ncbi:MAG: methylmalonyl Co-A mutase-associated GTPase MeaB [Thermoplasmata archaeon]
MSLVEALLAGDKRAAAKLISLIEDGDEQATEVIRAIYRKTGKAQTVAVSGPPGSGKSTLIYRLAQAFRRRGRTVGIIAVDPTSPLTGGALLGDRVRMGDLTADEGVFIRSMGTRGRLGGVSAATSDAINVLDAFGSDVIFVETAGVGQTDVEVAALTQTMVVLLMPGTGDDVQVFKAGIFEVADLFVVNKADRGGAEAVAADLEVMVGMGEERGWVPPVLLASGLRDEGSGEIADKIEAHSAYLAESGQLETKRRTRVEREILAALSESIQARGLALRSGQAFSAWVERVLQKEASPREAAQGLLDVLGPEG